MQTTHVARINGEEFEYQAIADEFIITASDKQSRGMVVSYTYLKAAAQTGRPVVFLFNGGPGSSSHWLHIGGFGPRRALPTKSAGIAPNFTHNNESLIGRADMVFIDPVGTGLSKAPNRTVFWDIVEDAKSVSTFIQQWLKRYRRTGTPVYILGESYGALRATLVADELLRVHSTPITGLILLSPVQNYRNIRLPDGSVMGYVSYLPTYAATAWHHKLLPDPPANLETLLSNARAFASGPYASALIAGNRLSATQRTEIASQLTRYTGLPADEILQQDLRVKPLDFLLQAVRSADKKLSRLDARVTGPLEAQHERYGQDPFAALVRIPFEMAIRTYVKDQLQVSPRLGTYRTNARQQRGWRWNWNVWGTGNIPSGSRYINVMPNLERTLRDNKVMRVLVASGYFDFATPFFSAENALAELKLGQERVQHIHYEGGHMLYLDDKIRQKLARNIQAFLQPATE